MSIVEIANHAGVSTTTVSRVLNNLPNVRAETAKQVRASAEALNYDVLTSKRARHRSISQPRHSRRRTNALTILTVGATRDWLQLPVMAATVAGIARGAREHDLRLMLDGQLNWSKPSDIITNQTVDGALVFVPSSMKGTKPRESLALIRKHLPAVWVMGAGAAIPGVDHIAPDHQAIGFVALEYLKDRGCQNVAFLTLNPAWHLMRTRGQGFAAAAHDNHISTSYFLLSDDPTVGDLYGPRAIVENNLESLIARIAQARPRPDGLFISNDATTAQVYPLMQRLGIQPDRDIAVISCDNEEIRLSGLYPRPASIDCGAEEVGWRAVQQLVTRIENTDEPGIQINVAPRLVVPESFER